MVSSSYDLVNVLIIKVLYDLCWCRSSFLSSYLLLYHLGFNTKFYDISAHAADMWQLFFSLAEFHCQSWWLIVSTELGYVTPQLPISDVTHSLIYILAGNSPTCVNNLSMSWTRTFDYTISYPTCWLATT